MYVGGGMGAQSRVGRLLEEFIPAERAYAVSEAVKRVFDKHGNRKDRQRARIRFLIDDLGFEAFERLYREELAGLPAAGGDAPPAPAAPSPRANARAALPTEGFPEWRASNVTAQRQAGFYTMRLRND